MCKKNYHIRANKQRLQNLYTSLLQVRWVGGWFVLRLLLAPSAPHWIKCLVLWFNKVYGRPADPFLVLIVTDNLIVRTYLTVRASRAIQRNWWWNVRPSNQSLRNNSFILHQLTFWHNTCADRQFFCFIFFPGILCVCAHFYCLLCGVTRHLAPHSAREAFGNQFGSHHHVQRRLFRIFVLFILCVCASHSHPKIHSTAPSRIPFAHFLFLVRRLVDFIQINPNVAIQIAHRREQKNAKSFADRRSTITTNAKRNCTITARVQI